MTKYHYLFVIGFILLSAAFIILTFRPLPTRFWKQYLKMQVVVLVGYLAWDTWAIYKKAWYFDRHQILGWYLIPKLPIEEVLFFLVVPFVTILTYLSLGKLANHDLVKRLGGKK